MPRAEGPYKALKRLSDNTYKINLEGYRGLSATFKIKDLLLYLEDSVLRKILFKGGNNMSPMG